MHLLAHLAPAPDAKHLAKSAWNVAKHPLPPVRRHVRRAAFAWRRHAAVPLLNGWGSSVVVVVVVVVVVTVWAAARPAPPSATAPDRIAAAIAFVSRSIPVPPRTSPARRAGGASASGCWHPSSLQSVP